MEEDINETKARASWLEQKEMSYQLKLATMQIALLMEEGGHTTMGEGDHYELILEEKVFGNQITMESH